MPSYEDYWRGVFEKACNEPDQQRRDELLKMCVNARAPDRHGEALNYEIASDHPRCDIIKQYFNAHRMNHGLSVTRPAKAERGAAPDPVFVPRPHFAR